MKFNEGQQAAIRAEKNAVILAGAGSGKTTVLAERFLYLVETKGVNIDQVLCLTFTRKAAAEMYERIYSRLQQSASSQARKQLKAFDRAQISTIDSFCAQVVRNWPEHFGLPEDFTFEDTNRLSEAAGLDFILENYEQPALAALIDTLGFEQIWHELFTSLAEQYFNLAIEHDFGEMHDKQITILKTTLQAALEEYADCCSKILALEPAGKSIMDAQAVLRELPDLKQYAENGAYRELDDLLAAITLKKPGGKESPATRILKDWIDRVRSLTVTLAGILDTLANSGLIRETFLLLDAFRKYYHNIKRSRNRVNFQDAAHMAVAALLKNRQLRRYYKQKYRYIMIDEFQDNNLLQKQLLFLLAEKQELELDRIPAPPELETDKLFFVGDDKQSIYRFRGADVSVFKELNRELTATASPPVSLGTNYRSAPGLIAFFNDLFGSLLAGAKEKYEADFQELAALPGSRLPVPQITFLYKPYNKQICDTEEAPAFSNDEAEAYAVAEFIKQAVAGRTLPVAENGTTRAAGYNDFTVLMRSTSNQIIYEKMFRLFGIPYSSQSVRSLFLEAPVNDIYNLLQLALYPADRVAYAAYLRSPFAHLADETLLAVLRQQKAPFTESLELPEAEQKKWDAAGSLYRYVQEEIDHCSLYALVSLIWYESGYRYFILKNRKFHNYLEFYDYLAGLAARFDARGENLAAFLDYIRENLGKYEKLEEDLEILKQEISGVQLMTIHKSKGLEFEIVVLANTGNKGKGAQGKKPYWVSDEYGLTLNIGTKNWFQSIAETENKKKELAENKRLLYVALTRAKSHLVISGVHNKLNLNSEEAHLNMLLNHFRFFPKGESPANTAYILSSTIINELEQAAYNAHRVHSGDSKPGQLKLLYEKIPVLSRECVQKDFTVQELNEQFTADLAPGVTLAFPAAPVDKCLESKTEKKQFGTLTHFIIEQHLKHAVPVIVPDYLKIGFPPDLYNEIEQAARQMAANFLSSDLGSLAYNAPLLETEFAFLYKFTKLAQPCFIRGVMDLYFETGAHAYIIDFKTDRTICKSHYVLQLALYYLAAKELTDKPVMCLLFPLRSSEPVDLTDEVIRITPAAAENVINSMIKPKITV